MTRVGAVIPIRLTSSRLPRKSLQPIEGRPAVHHLLDRCFASRHLSPEHVIVATTTDPEDDDLLDVVQKTGARVFRGARDDLVDRTYRAAEAHGLDVIAQVDGDDPCTDTGYLDLCVDRMLERDGLDVVHAEGLPLGVASRIIARPALDRLFATYKPGRNDTGFMYYFLRSGLFEVDVVTPASPADTHPTLRLTLDYDEDLAFFRAVFAELYRPGEVFAVGEIVDLVGRRPELLELNSGLDDAYWERTRQIVAEEAMEINGPHGVVRIEG